ncbi:MAG: hypothetical protein HY286_17020 [Planctomycetes bacterium]|nr:hypothetical protein [Planctomycetota bacterium]
MEYARRAFIQCFALTAAAIGVGPGLLHCFAQDSRPASRPAKPGLLDAAFAQIATTRQACVVLRLPDAPEDKQTIGEAWVRYIYECDNRGLAVLDRMAPPDFELHAIFAEAVFVFLTKEEAEAAAVPFKTGESLCWIDIHRARLGGAAAAVGDHCHRDTFVKNMNGMLHGRENEILIKRAAACEAGMNAGERRALRAHIENGETPKNWKDGIARVVGRQQNPLNEYQRERGGFGGWRGIQMAEDPDGNGWMGISWLRLVNIKIENDDEPYTSATALRNAPYLINLLLSAAPGDRRLRIEALLEESFRTVGATRGMPGLPFGISVSTAESQSGSNKQIVNYVNKKK